MPTGTLPLEDRQLIAVGENIFLEIRLPDNVEGSYTSDGADNLDADEFLPSTNRTEVEYPSDVHLTDESGKRNAEWSDKSTRLLIQQYAEKKPLVEDRKIKTMKRMWERRNEKTPSGIYVCAD